MDVRPVDPARRRGRLPLDPEVEAEVLAILDAWCVAHRLMTCTARRAELLAEPERADGWRYRALVRAKTLRRLLGIHQHVLNLERLDAQANLRRRERRARAREKLKQSRAA